MKIPGRGRLLSTWPPQPIEAQKKMREGMVLAPTPGTLATREAMYYTLSRPVSTVMIVRGSIARIEESVKLAREFTPMGDAQAAQ